MEFKTITWTDENNKIIGAFDDCWITTNNGSLNFFDDNGITQTEIKGKVLGCSKYLITIHEGMTEFYIPAFITPILSLKLDSKISMCLYTTIGLIMYDPEMKSIVSIDLNNNNTVKPIKSPPSPIFLSYRGIYCQGNMFITWENLLSDNIEYEYHECVHINNVVAKINTGTEIELSMVVVEQGVSFSLLMFRVTVLIAHSSLTHKILWSVNLNTEVFPWYPYIIYNNTVFDMKTNKLVYSHPNSNIFCMKRVTSGDEYVCV